MDSFYVGKLKGVGKVWQLTACDCASSFGWARLLIGEVTAAGAMASFLRAARLSASGVAAAARAHGPGEGIQVPLTNVCKESKSSPRLNCVESATCESQQ